MPFPPVEPLHEHLIVLRDASDPADPRHDRRWREIARWLEQAFPARDLEDARQEALVSLVRYVPLMRAETPLQAAKWVSTIVRHKRLDVARSRSKDPVHKALERESRREDATAPLERLIADEPRLAEPAVLDSLVTTVLEHVHRALEETEHNAARRQLRRTQAQATLLRLVSDADADEIARALDCGEPIGKDRVYKWVERGRPVVQLGLDRWARTADAEEREEIAPVIAALRDLVDQRRADAGVPRPERRRDRTEEGP